MKLKAIYTDISECPEAYRLLYTERGGQFELTGIEGIQTQANVERLERAKQHEAAKRKEAEDKLKKFRDLDPDEVHKSLDELGELRTRVDDGGKGEEAIQKRIEAAVKRALAPIERERDTYREKFETRDKEAAQMQASWNSDRIARALSEAGTKAGVAKEAIDDVLMYAAFFEIDADGKVVTREGVNGVMAGMDPASWLGDTKTKKPHWWGTTSGGGATGGKTGGATGNPFTRGKFDIMGANDLVKRDPAQALKMAQAAGFSSVKQAVQAGATENVKTPVYQPVR